jgi:hypothetical protein
MSVEKPRPLLTRLAWFALLWIVGVAIIGAIAFAIRLLIL